MTTVAVVALAVLFFALIMASIALHEIGHLLPAKMFGVKVTQYFVGFGRTLWSRRRGETEYGIKAIPLGGYVRLVGMYPPERPAEEKGWLTRLADDARSAEYEEISAADDGHLLYQKPVWQRIVVMLGGPTMNLVLAFVIFLGINALHGTYQPTLEVARVSDCIVEADRADRECREGDPATPATQAGLEVGDRIVEFNGVALSDWDQMSELIRENRDQAATLVVERDGAVTALPEVRTVITGVPDRLDPTATVEAGFLGVSPRHELTRGGIVATAEQMWEMTRMSAVALVSFPVRIYNVAVDLVTGQPRDPNSPLSIVGASRVAGEIGVAEDIPVPDRVASWFSLLGSVNLFVALLNLVPLPPLDGGHIAGALYDGLRRALATLLRRPTPHPADTAKLLPVVYLVGGFLLVGGVVLIIADVITPISLF